MQAEERHQQQQWEKEKLDREEAREKEKAEREEALKQLEIQQKREEMESRERIRMRELELQQERLTRTDREPENDDGNDSASSHGSAASSTRRRSRAGPKLPYFDDAKDNIDSYLRRFERYAELQGWPTQEWAIYLSALLKGNALEVYSRLAETESKSYDKLKSALLRKYDLTVDGFRKRFYDARRERNETAVQFVCRLVGYLDRWVQLAKIEQTYEGLKDLIVREQFLAVSDEKLTLYLRERSSHGLQELVSLADLYLEARHEPSRSHKEFTKKDKRYDRTFSVKKDHAASSNTPNKNNYKPSSSQEAEGERVCYSCGKSGHIRRFCPQRKPDGANGRGRDNRLDTVASCQVVDDERRCSRTHESESGGTLKLQCGCELPYVGCLTMKSDVRTSRLPIEAGKANGVDVSVLRDTGCTTIVIRRDLVQDSQLTGEFRYYRMLDGTVKKAEIALVDMETPYVSGKLPCLCIDAPTCDVIVGNVQLAPSSDNMDEVNAVTTRAQALAEGKPPRPMSVPTIEELKMPVADVQKLQRESVDLRKWFDHAKEGHTAPSGKTASVKFIVERGLLYLSCVPNRAWT